MHFRQNPVYFDPKSKSISFFLFLCEVEIRYFVRFLLNFKGPRRINPGKGTSQTSSSIWAELCECVWSTLALTAARAEVENKQIDSQEEGEDSSLWQWWAPFFPLLPITVNTYIQCIALKYASIVVGWWSSLIKKPFGEEEDVKRSRQEDDVHTHRRWSL